MSVSNQYDLMTQEFAANPHPTYRRILEEAPVHWNQSVHGWVVAPYDAVAPSLSDTRLSSKRLAPVFAKFTDEHKKQLEIAFRLSAGWAVNSDPPEHTQLRRLTGRAFAPSMVASMRPRTQELADKLIDAFEKAGQADLVKDFAYPLPSTIILDMVGVEPSYQERFLVWAATAIQLIGLGIVTDESVAQVRGALMQMDSYLRDVMARRRAEPRNDIVSHLLEVQGLHGSPTDDQIIGKCIEILLAGNEGVMPMIGNAILALLDHPDQMQKLRSDPSLIDSAIEELIRFDTPVHRVGRMAVEDIEMYGQRIAKGDLVWLALGAANRDPRQFDEPERLNILRKENKHLGFGSGIHFCEGAVMARDQLRIAVGTLIRRLPNLGLAVAPEKLDWIVGTNARGARSIPIVF